MSILFNRTLKIETFISQMIEDYLVYFISYFISDYIKTDFIAHIYQIVNSSVCGPN